MADRLRTAGVTVSTILGHALVVSDMYRLGERFLDTEQSRRLSRYQDAEQYGNRSDILIQHIARMSPEQQARNQVSLSEALRVIKALHDGNVNLVPGTDSNTEYAIAGMALHEEMELLIAAGLSPYEVLRTATVNSARLLESLDHQGTIEVGKDANLILVAENPLDGIVTLRTPTGVMVNGRFLGAKELEAMRLARGL
ncbi:MAG: amidohydrolase family protein [Gemmatimonadetes bacterium]|nr:amidohydrolase family protein [Gemmatimonadota bacterium]